MKLRTNPKRTDKVLESTLPLTPKTTSRVSISTPVQPSKVVKTHAGPGRPRLTPLEPPKTPVAGVTPKGRGRPPKPKPDSTATPTTTTAKTSVPQSRSKTKADEEDDDTKVVIKVEEEDDGTEEKEEETPPPKPKLVDLADTDSGSTPATATTSIKKGSATSKSATNTPAAVPPKVKATVPTPAATAKASTPAPAPAPAPAESKTKAAAKTPVSSTSTKPDAEKVVEAAVSTPVPEPSKITKPDETVVAVVAPVPPAPVSPSKPSQSSPVKSTGVTLRGSTQSKAAASATSSKSEKIHAAAAAVVKEPEATTAVAVVAKPSEPEQVKTVTPEEPKATTTPVPVSVPVVPEEAPETAAVEPVVEVAAVTTAVPVPVSVPATSPAVKENKQLVVKLDKLAPEVSTPAPAPAPTPTPAPGPKRSERTSTVMKRKLSEDPPAPAPVKPTPGKRGRPPKQLKAQQLAASSKETDSETSAQDKDHKTKDKGKDKDVDMDTSAPKEKEKKDKDKDKDERSFERFYSKIKDTSVVSERWSFGGVLWDPTKKMKVMAASEVDVTSNGNMRLRRCVQVFETYAVRVMVEGADMTKTFSTTGTVNNANEVTQLIHKVATSKICTGIKNFGTTDKIYFPHCVLRGESYFAPECPIVIDYGVVGPLCQHCNRLRNMIHRRNIKETNLLYSKFSRAPVKNIRSGFGKQLYSMLTDLVEASSVDAKKERKKLRRMIPSNAKEYPFRSDSSKMTTTMIDGLSLEENQQIQIQQQQQLQMQLAQQQMQMHQQQQMQQYIKSDASGNITISSIPGNTICTPVTGSSDYIRLAKPYNMGQNTGEVMTYNIMSGQRGSFKMSRDGGQLQTVSTSGGNFTTTISGSACLTPSEMHMVEQLCLQEGHDAGNIIIQNSGDFTLAEGQEYELIGEADSDNPIQVLEVLKEENQQNQTIEIIEVDDQTLAQLTSQNLGNYIIQEPSSGFEVQEIDANDPNFRHLVKALNPGTLMYQSN